MTASGNSCPAHQIACRHAVALHIERDGSRVSQPLLGLKTERIGKEYLHHYVVPLFPRPRENEMALIYVDPDQPLIDLGFAVAFRCDHQTTAVEVPAPRPGDIITTPHGRFLKLHEDPLSQKTFAYLDIAEGTLHRRREKAVSACCTAWSAGRDGAPPGPSAAPDFAPVAWDRLRLPDQGSKT